MKNRQNFFSQLIHPHFTISLFCLFFSLFLLLLISACSSNQTEVAIESPSYQAHVAFAGGGWRAHSGHSGWIIALLNNGNRTLDAAFGKVKTISSNSGGSWFSSMLMYSDVFASQIQATDAGTTWAQTGWLGRQEQLFNNAPGICSTVSGDEFTACVVNYYTSSSSIFNLHPFGASNWKKVTDSVVFRDYPLINTLNNSPIAWAADKSLLLAGSLLTSQVVLNGNDDTDINFYQACLPALSPPILNGKQGANCSFNGPIPIVTPVTFSRIPSGFGLTAPPFLSALKANDSISIGYTDNTWWKSDTVSRMTALQNPISNDQLLVQAAAAASSAALGFDASVNVSGSFYESYGSEAEALSFQLKGQTVQYFDPGDEGVVDFAEKKAVRIADGGPVDNSGVAQLIRHLQLNSMDDGFNVIAFDNVQQPFSYGGDTVGMDIANLFGEGVCKGASGIHQFCLKNNCGSPCIDIPNLDIFVSDSLATGKTVWTVTKSNVNPIQKIVYTKYSVKTVANANYGITKDSEGTLHAFSCIWENADISPTNGGDGSHPFKFTDYDFKAYAQMIEFINRSMQANGGVRLQEMEKAFGIGQ